MARFIVDTNKLSLQQIQDIRRVPDIWLKLGDSVQHSVHEQMSRVRKTCPAMLDEKWYDTAARINEKLRGLNRLLDKPAIATISGALPLKTIRTAVENRGKIGIIVTGPLSDWPLKSDERVAELVLDSINQALRVGAQGVTCPGYLLPQYVQASLPHDFMTIATGIRSEGKPAGGHTHPITPEKALQAGAWPVISEIAYDENPAAELSRMVARCEHLFH